MPMNRSNPQEQEEVFIHHHLISNQYLGYRTLYNDHSIMKMGIDHIPCAEMHLCFWLRQGLTLLLLLGSAVPSWPICNYNIAKTAKRTTQAQLGQHIKTPCQGTTNPNKTTRWHFKTEVQRQEDQGFKAVLGYIISPRTAWAICNPIKKKRGVINE